MALGLQRVHQVDEQSVGLRSARHAAISSGWIFPIQCLLPRSVERLLIPGFNFVACVSRYMRCSTMTGIFLLSGPQISLDGAR